MGEKLRIEHYEVTTTKVEARRVGQLHFRRVVKSEEEDGGETSRPEDTQRV
jgi:Mg2+/Co2+ transporter CorC